MPSRTKKGKIPLLHSSTATARTSTSARRFAWWRAPPPASWSPPPATVCAAPQAHSGAWSGTRAPAPEPAAPCPARSVARWGVWWEASAPASPSCTRGRTLRVWANTQTRAPTTRSPFLRDSERTGPRPLCPRAAPRRSSPRPRLSFCSPRRLLSGRTTTCGAPRRFWRASPNRSRRRDGATEREPTNRPGSRRAVRRTRNQSPRSARSRRRPEDWRPSGWTCRRASCDEKGWCSRSRAPRSRRRRARPSSSS